MAGGKDNDTGQNKEYIMILGNTLNYGLFHLNYGVIKHNYGKQAVFTCIYGGNKP